MKANWNIWKKKLHFFPNDRLFQNGYRYEQMRKNQSFRSSGVDFKTIKIIAVRNIKKLKIFKIKFLAVAILRRLRIWKVLRIILIDSKTIIVVLLKIEKLKFF